MARLLIATAFSTLLWVGHAGAQAVLLTSYDALEPELGAKIDFEGLPRTPSPGRAVEGIAQFEGASLAERFAGQIVAQSDGFDALQLTPAAPLSLQPGAPGQNLAVEFVYFMSNLMMGTAPPGHPSRQGGGEGAVSILFDRDQKALGFRVASEPQPRDGYAAKGWMQVSFYRRDGSLIDRLDVELDWSLAGYGFRRVGDAEDIAGISITNRDPEGVMIDDVIFDQMLVLGFANLPTLGR
jgi:hypothetical protein